MKNTKKNERVVNEPVAQDMSGVVGEDTESDNEPFAGTITTVVKQQLTNTTMVPFKDHNFGTIFRNKQFKCKK